MYNDVPSSRGGGDLDWPAGLLNSGVVLDHELMIHGDESAVPGIDSAAGGAGIRVDRR